MTSGPKRSRSVWSRPSVENALLVGACVVAVVTPGIAPAVALCLAAALVAAFRRWPRGEHVRGQQMQSGAAVVLMTGASLALALEAWTVAAGLAILVALVMPRAWVRSFAAETHTSTESFGGS